MSTNKIIIPQKYSCSLHCS